MERQRTQSATAVEFTYDWYRKFLDRIMAAGHEFKKFSENVGPGDVLLRHDVDLSLEDAVTMARMEAARGVTSTYCILLTSALYNPLEGQRHAQIQEIESLGHEVALHFSTHEYWDSDHQPSDDVLLDRVGDERSVLGTLVSDTVETVSFHSPPSWVLNRDYEGVRNAYGPTYFEEMTYVADSGQRWRESPPQVDDLGSSAQILTHPGLWAESDGSFEERIERAVTSASRHANEKAQREFIEGSL